MVRSLARAKSPGQACPGLIAMLTGWVSKAASWIEWPVSRPIETPAAGIAQRDNRGRVLDVPGLRITFAMMLIA